MNSQVSEILCSFLTLEILSNIKLPVLTLIAAINVKVIGFPKKVPNIDAKTFALNKYAKKAPNKKWNPNKGEKEANTPKERPNAILCGVSGSLLILWLIYSIALLHPLSGKNKDLRFLNMVSFFFSLKNHDRSDN